jgi:hypothetical protein
MITIAAPVSGGRAPITADRKRTLAAGVFYLVSRPGPTGAGSRLRLLRCERLVPARRVSIAGHELTVLAMPEGFRGPVRIGVGDEVRELGAGDSCVFTLSHDPSRPSRAT